MDLEIRHLRLICVIAEAGSLTRAAARMDLSQPAITKQLHHLEAQVGGALFVRGHDGVSPTPLGRQVISRARTALSELDQIFGDLRQPRGTTRPLRIGCVHLAGVASVVDRVSKAIPDRDVTLRIEPSSMLLAESLSHGHLDAALLGILEGYEIALAPPIASRTLVPRYPMFIALSARHRLSGSDQIRLADLADESWVGPPGADDGSLAALRATCRAEGFEPKVRYEAPSGGAHTLVARGHGVRVVDPTWPAAPDTIVRPLAGDPQVARLVVAWRRDLVSHDEAGALYDGLVAAFADHVGDNPTFARWWEKHPEVHPMT